MTKEINRLKQKARRLESKLAGIAYRFAAREVQPVIQAFCDKYGLNFFTGIGWGWYFAPPVADIRYEILALNDTATRFDNDIQDAVRLRKLRGEPSLDEELREQLLCIVKEFRALQPLLNTPTGLGNNTSIGIFCENYAKEER